MLLYKGADITLQLLAVFIPIVAGMLAGVFFLLFIYYTLGFVQVISCIINRIYLPAQYMHPQRHRYNICIVVIAIIVIAASLVVLLGNDYISAVQVSGMIIIGGFAMLVIGFVLAFWYFVITITEKQYIRELVKSTGF